MNLALLAVLIFLGLELLAWLTLNTGLEHPKWYVNFYTLICYLWETLVGIIIIVTGFFWVELIPMLYIKFIPIFVIPPLIPLWYLYFVVIGMSPLAVGFSGNRLIWVLKRKQGET